jgi:predicted Fe-Mo cluster-binding NifX family protein
VKVAIPTFNSRVSPRFDFAAEVLIATVDDGKVVDREQHSLINLNTLRRGTLLREQGVDLLICGGITDFTVRLLLGNGIQVVPMVAGEIEEVLEKLINGDFDSATTPASYPLTTGRYHTRKGRYRGNRMDSRQK